MFIINYENKESKKKDEIWLGEKFLLLDVFVV